MSKQIFREYFSEFLGVFGLVYFGGWSVLLATAGKMDMLGVAMVHSAVLGLFIWIGCSYAGCHFNPALTIGFFAINEIGATKALFYIISQLIGTYSAALSIKYTAPMKLLESAQNAGADFGGPHQSNEFSWFAASLLELIGTFMLMFTVKSLCAENQAKRFSPLIGSVVGLCIMCFGSFTGTGVNPFRYLGPALVAVKLGDFYIYMIPPIIGAVAAAYAYESMFNFDKEEDLGQPLQ
jgi:glycerol uptake facilitator-like aquaporin